MTSHLQNIMWEQELKTAWSRAAVLSMERWKIPLYLKKHTLAITVVSKIPLFLMMCISEIIHTLRTASWKAEAR